MYELVTLGTWQNACSRICKKQELKEVARDANFADDWVEAEQKRKASRLAAIQETVQTAVANPVEVLKDKLMAGAHGSGVLLQVKFPEPFDWKIDCNSNYYVEMKNKN